MSVYYPTISNVKEKIPQMAQSPPIPRFRKLQPAQHIIPVLLIPLLNETDSIPSGMTYIYEDNNDRPDSRQSNSIARNDQDKKNAPRKIAARGSRFPNRKPVNSYRYFLSDFIFLISHLSKNNFIFVASARMRHIYVFRHFRLVQKQRRSKFCRQRSK